MRLICLNFCTDGSGKGVEHLETKASTRIGLISYLKYIWKEGRTFYLLALLFFPAYIVANFVQIYLPKLVVQELEEQKTIVHLGISVLIIVIILMVSVFLREKIRAKIQSGNRKLVQQMSNDYANKMLYVDYGYLEDPKFMVLRNKTKESLFGGSIGDGNGANARIDNFMQTSVAAVAVVGNLLLYSYYLYLLTPWLLMILVITNASMFLMNQLQIKYENSYSKELSEAWQKLDYASRKAGDFSMAKDVRLYQMKGWISMLIDKYCKVRLGYKAKEMKIGMLDSTVFAIISGIYYACFYGCVLQQLWIGNLAISDVIFYAGMGPVLYQMTDYDLIQNVKGIIHSSIAFHRFEIFMNYGENTGVHDIPLQKQAPLLELKDVSFTYPGAEEAVLSHFNLRVEPGEKIAVVGINGAGKTTLMKLICGLLHPTTGTILLNGKDMEEMEAEERYTYFSCAFQDVQFLPVSIRENIAMQAGDISDDERIWYCLRQAGMEETIQKLPHKLDTRMEKNIHDDAVDFSGGQRQKLIFARALYRETGVLILDEPTAALDALAENEIYEKYADFSKDKTSFFVSHRLSSTRFCDRILLIDGGTIAEEGTHEELLTRDGLYAKMFSMQSQYYKGGEAV